MIDATAPAGVLPSVTVLIPTTGSELLKEIVACYLADPVVSQVLVAIDNPSLDVASLEMSLPADQRLTVLHNPGRLGLTRSLNRALVHANGEIILRNDDDDPPAPQRARAVADFFVGHPSCDLAFSFARGIDQGSGKSWDITGPQTDAEIKQKLLQHNFIVHSSLAFRRESVSRIGDYDETFMYAQDYDLYLRAIRHGLRFGCIPQVLVARTYHSASITVARRKRQILFSFAARLVHIAATEDAPRLWRTILQYCWLLLIPNVARTLKRRLGYGR